MVEVERVIMSERRTMFKYLRISNPFVQTSSPSGKHEARAWRRHLTAKMLSTKHIRCNQLDNRTLTKTGTAGAGVRLKARTL